MITRGTRNRRRIFGGGLRAGLRAGVRQLGRGGPRPRHRRKSRSMFVRRGRLFMGFSMKDVKRALRPGGRVRVVKPK